MTLNDYYAKFSHPRRIVRLFCPIVGILVGLVDRLWDYLAVCDTLTTQLVRHDLSMFAILIYRVAQTARHK